MVSPKEKTSRIYSAVSNGVGFFLSPRYTLTWTQIKSLPDQTTDRERTRTMGRIMWFCGLMGLALGTLSNLPRWGSNSNE